MLEDTVLSLSHVLTVEVLTPKHSVQDWTQINFYFFNIKSKIIITIYNLQFTIHNLQFTICNNTNIIYYLLFTIYYLLFTIYYLLFTIYYLLFTIYYLLFTIYYLLFTIYYLSFMFTIYFYKTYWPTLVVLVWSV